MFYTVLFLLACYNLYKSVKRFVKENIIAKDDEIAEIPKAAYISLGAMVLFYLMVLAICVVPSILF